ncbi:MAG: HNH endonuclease [Candidatus Yanofskybacteria bacterium]|nr:HNH endonuclease [Candidatus Yanofskybacteria bacterium]
MNYRLWTTYSVVLMSQRGNAPYADRVHDDGITIEYEGHDEPRSSDQPNPKTVDQPSQTSMGTPTQNGLFKKAVDDFKAGKCGPEKVKVYEKLYPGVWSLKGFFDLRDYEIVHDGVRNVFRFILRLSEDPTERAERVSASFHTRVIPSEVKKAAYKRDKGQCQICGSKVNLHFDHDLPYSKGGSSLTAENVRLLCAKHNLEKGAKIQ